MRDFINDVDENMYREEMPDLAESQLFNYKTSPFHFRKRQNLCIVHKMPLIYFISVTQYGFITCFAVACPLGPLLALTRNIFEVRVDAKKLLLHSRRSSSNQINTVEAFTSVLEVVTYFCIVTNVRN